jgi:anti-sigma regulatory factor (Ser/Thr protein kinase)
VLAVTDSSQVGDARRVVAGLGQRMGLGEPAAGRLALIVTEAAGNLVKHARGGEIVVRPVARAGGTGIEILALDRGPGIADVARALRDGYSTHGTPGTGLGAIRRLSGEFDLYSVHGRGTALFSRVWAENVARPDARLQVGVVCLPKPGEGVSGDAWKVAHHVEGARVLVVDGLGHGPDAHRAAHRALAAAAGERGGPGAVVDACHHALRSTRGAALAVADVDLERGRVRYAGVGNLTGTVLGRTRRQNMVSTNGTAGQGTVRVREFEYTWEPGSLLVMATDGLATRWALDDYPGLAVRHPALVAGVLYRDHARRRDDVAVLALREREQASERLA